MNSTTLDEPMKQVRTAKLS